MSQEEKFQVDVSTPAKPKRVPKIVGEQLKGAASPKMLSKMKKERVDYPVVKKESLSSSALVARLSLTASAALLAAPQARATRRVAGRLTEPNELKFVLSLTLYM